MTKHILESQGIVGEGAVLETQSNTLPDNFVANPMRITWVQRENRIIKIRRERRIVKSMATKYYEYEHAFGAFLEYGFDWTDSTWWAAGDTIATSSWVASSGAVILGNQSNVSGVTSVEPTGLLKDKVYRLTNTIVTVAGKTDSRTLTLSCKRR